MSDEHRNEPRDIGYSKEHKDTYKEWTKKDSNSIFAGCTQADLFFFSVAVGFNRDKQGEPKNKTNDIPVSALSEKQKWAILSTSISKGDDLGVLKDEKQIYTESEKYAEEGLKIVKSHIERLGNENYIKELEIELREILEG